MVHGAIFKITVKHERLSLDSVALAKVQGVDLTTELSFPPIQLVACYDQTSITSPGVIYREVRVPFTPDFMAAHQNDDARHEVLEGLMAGPIRANVPAYDVSVEIDIQDFSC